jgi:dTDP-4-amino-4,6-dideoxygalactose transaminase
MSRALRLGSSSFLAPYGRGASPSSRLSRMSRIFLSPPHIGDAETKLVADALASGWIAPLGPQVNAFQEEFADAVGAKHAVALSSGTAALHLALIAAGVGAGDEVMVSTLTFSASVNPIVYQGATPVLVDSEGGSWNIDPSLVAQEFDDRARSNRLPKALVVVHLYGQAADLDPIRDLCEHHGVILIEDAAEALGSTYRGRAPGSDGFAGIFSFNGNKIITTSGGGMLVTPHEKVAALALKLASQARESAAHYEHTMIGYNYRMSNILAALGRGQLSVLPQRVAARRLNFSRYEIALSDCPGVTLQKEAVWGTHSRWLTVMQLDTERCGIDREAVRLALEAADIESRPVWKPMHLQPIFASAPRVGGVVAEELFKNGLCLPSGSNLTAEQHARVCEVLLSSFKANV